MSYRQGTKWWVRVLVARLKPRSPDWADTLVGLERSLAAN